MIDFQSEFELVLDSNLNYKFLFPSNLSDMINRELENLVGFYKYTIMSNFEYSPRIYLLIQIKP